MGRWRQEKSVPRKVGYERFRPYTSYNTNFVGTCQNIWSNGRRTFHSRESYLASLFGLHFILSSLCIPSRYSAFGPLLLAVAVGLATNNDLSKPNLIGPTPSWLLGGCGLHYSFLSSFLSLFTCGREVTFPSNSMRGIFVFSFYRAISLYLFSTPSVAGHATVRSSRRFCLSSC